MNKYCNAFYSFNLQCTLIHLASRLNHSHYDLNADENDFATLDFAALDRLAGYDKDGSNEDDRASTRDGGEEAPVQELNGMAEGGSSVRSRSPVGVQAPAMLLAGSEAGQTVI